jgi:hypothetical protein
VFLRQEEQNARSRKRFKSEQAIGDGNAANREWVIIGSATFVRGSSEALDRVSTPV